MPPSISPSLSSESNTIAGTPNSHKADGSVETTVGGSEVTMIPPDGGRQAWLTIAGSWVVIFCTFGYLNSFGVYQDFYTREFLKSNTASDISWIGSFQLFLLYAPGVFVGKAFDAGFFHHIMIAGSLLYTFSLFMLSLTQPGQYWQVFLSQGLGAGLGQGLLFLPSLSIISHHFRLKRALATGIAVTGASCGGIVFPIILNILQEKIGWKEAVRVSAGVVGVLLLGANCIMKARVVVLQKSGVENGAEKERTTCGRMKSILQDGAYVWSVAGAFFANLGLFFPYFYLQLYAIEIGVKPETAFYALAILNAGSILGRLLPTFLADRIGVYTMLIPCLVLSSVLLFTILGVKTRSGIVIVGVWFGFGSGAYVSLIPSLLAMLSTDMGELGLRMGTAFTVVAFAMLLGTPIEGALVGDHFLWLRAIIFCGLCIATGTTFMIISRHLYIRRRKGRSQLV